MRDSARTIGHSPSDSAAHLREWHPLIFLRTDGGLLLGGGRRAIARLDSDGGFHVGADDAALRPTSADRGEVEPTLGGNVTGHRRCTRLPVRRWRGLLLRATASGLG